MEVRELTRHCSAKQEPEKRIGFDDEKVMRIA
jgi:hypothetical protein